MKRLKYIVIPIVFFTLIELCLRYLGFGDPVLYMHSENNYYPKSNQQNIRYKGARININQFGMRTNSDWSNYLDKKKIIFFGDSVTYGGSYIDNENLFSQKVCDNFLKNTICGNYGVNGYSIKNIYLRIKKIDKRYYDQIVIVVSSEIENNLSKFSNFPFYEKFDYFLLKASFEILNHFMFKYKIYDAFHEEEQNDLIDQQNKSISLRKLLNSIANDKEVIIFILPTLEDIINKKQKNNFLESSNFEKIKTINLFNKISQSDYENLYFNNAHLNKKGHEHIAKIIYEYIK